MIFEDRENSLLLISYSGNEEDFQTHERDTCRLDLGANFDSVVSPPHGWPRVGLKSCLFANGIFASAGITFTGNIFRCGVIFAGQKAGFHGSAEFHYLSYVYGYKCLNNAFGSMYMKAAFRNRPNTDVHDLTSLYLLSLSLSLSIFLSFFRSNVVSIIIIDN